MKLTTFFAIDTPYTVLGDKPRVNLVTKTIVDKIKMNVRARREISILLVMCKYQN